MSTDRPEDFCAKCGHHKVFHRIAQGTGCLPAGTAYCDDRYSDPCNCTTFEPAADPRRERVDRVLKHERGAKSLYLIGSLRNPRVPEIANELRGAGWDVFDDWYAAGEKADDSWRDYERARGHDCVDALKGYAAQHVDEFDQYHLDRCQVGVLVMPAGKSAFLELGQMIGAKKPAYIILDGDPERYDVMFRRATGVFRSVEEAVKCLHL